MDHIMHLEATVKINSDGDLLEYPACESMADYNSGRWTDDIEDVTCVDCTLIWITQP